MSTKADESSQPTQSNRYYDDTDALTYDEAEIIVRRYFRQDVQRSVTRVKHVLEAFDKPYTNHNHRRVVEVLRDRCEVIDPDTSRPLKFRIPDEYCN